MQSTIYFSFVRGREGELNAIERLSPCVLTRVSIVVDLPTVEATFGKSLDEHIGQFTRNIAKAWGVRSPLYLDLTRYGPEHVDSHGRNIVEHLFDCARQLKLKAVPVTGPWLIADQAQRTWTR